MFDEEKNTVEPLSKIKKSLCIIKSKTENGSYNDVQVISNPEEGVTVVLGKLLSDTVVWGELDNLIWKTSNMLYDATREFPVKGVAHCSPVDDFDEKTGLIVASRRAEQQGLIKRRQEYKKVLKYLERATELCKLRIQKDTDKIQKIKEKLDSFK